MPPQTKQAQTSTEKPVETVLPPNGKISKRKGDRSHRALCLEMQHVPYAAVVLCSEEAFVHLCDAVTKHNFRHLTRTTPVSYIESPLHCPHMTV